MLQPRKSIACGPFPVPLAQYLCCSCPCQINRVPLRQPLTQARDDLPISCRMKKKCGWTRTPITKQKILSDTSMICTVCVEWETLATYLWTAMAGFPFLPLKGQAQKAQREKSRCSLSNSWAVPGSWLSMGWFSGKTDKRTSKHAQCLDWRLG